jgi:hypothetical protein
MGGPLPSDGQAMRTVWGRPCCKELGAARKDAATEASENR